MSDLKELTSIIEQAKTNGAAPITMTGELLLSLIQFARMIPGGPEVPAFAFPAAPAVTSLAVAEDETVSIKDVCDRLQIERSTLYKWRRDGIFDIKPVNVAGTKWLRTDFISWLKARRS